MASVDELEGFSFSSRGLPPPPVGEGEFGKVLEGIWNRKAVAVKVLSARVGDDDAEDESYSRVLCEAVRTLWAKLRVLPRHANVAAFAGVAGLAIRQPSLVRQEKYAMSLADRAKLEPRVEQRQRIDIAGDVMSGLAFLHGSGVVHGRLSASNVLLSEVKYEHCRVHLSDAGLYAVYGKVWGHGAASSDVRMKWLSPYTSPELESADIYVPTKKSDVFAYGLVVLAMEVCREPPSLITSPRTAEPDKPETDRHSLDLAIVEDTNPLKEIILKCVQNETYMRPSSEQLNRTLQEMKTLDEYIAANAVSRARVHLPADVFSTPVTEHGDGLEELLPRNALLAEPDVPGMRNDRLSASSEMTYPRLLHRESGPMAASQSMVSLNDEGSMTGVPSLASDGGSVNVDLPQLLRQVRTQLDSLRRSVLIVAHDMDDVRSESQAAHRQARSAHQAAMAARDEAGESRRQAAKACMASQGAHDEATLAHRESSAAKDACLRILSALSGGSFAAPVTGMAFGVPRPAGGGIGSGHLPLGSKLLPLDAGLRPPGAMRGGSISGGGAAEGFGPLSENHEHDLQSNTSDHGSISSLPSMIVGGHMTAPLAAATGAVTMGDNEAPPGHLDPLPFNTPPSSATNNHYNPGLEPPPGTAEDPESSGVPASGGGADCGVGGDMAGGGRAVRRLPSINSFVLPLDGESPRAALVAQRNQAIRMSGPNAFADSDPRASPGFISQVRRFDFALKCTVAAMRDPKAEKQHKRQSSGEATANNSTRDRAAAAVFEQASSSASQAFPFGEWCAHPETGLQVNSPCHMVVHNDTLYLVSREVTEAGKRTFLVTSTDLENWTEVALPASSATCHALFTYQHHVYVCARSTDKTGSGGGGGRGRSRGDVIWRLDASAADAAAEWTRVTQLPHVQWHYGATLDGSRLIIAGGWDGRHEVGHVVVFDLALGRWLEPLAPLPVPAFAARAFVAGDSLYLVGATTRQADLTEVYYLGLRPRSVAYNTWRTVRLPQSACGSCFVDKHIVTVGGWDNTVKQAVGDVYLFDTERSEWLMLPTIKLARVRPEVVHFKTKLVCLGGSVNPSRESDKVSQLEVMSLVL